MDKRGLRRAVPLPQRERLAGRLAVGLLHWPLHSRHAGAERLAALGGLGVRVELGGRRGNGRLQLAAGVLAAVAGHSLAVESARCALAFLALPCCGGELDEGREGGEGGEALLPLDGVFSDWLSGSYLTGRFLCPVFSGRAVFRSPEWPHLRATNVSRVHHGSFV